MHSDHFLLPLIMCNPGVVASGLFPEDHVEAQATLERWLLKPSKPIRTAVARVGTSGAPRHRRDVVPVLTG